MQEGPISRARSRAARPCAAFDCPLPSGTACGLLSAAQVDQKRRNENRERRLICVQPKREWQALTRPCCSSCVSPLLTELVASDEDAACVSRNDSPAAASFLWSTVSRTRIVRTGVNSSHAIGTIFDDLQKTGVIGEALVSRRGDSCTFQE